MDTASNEALSVFQYFAEWRNTLSDTKSQTQKNRPLGPVFFISTSPVKNLQRETKIRLERVKGIEPKPICHVSQ